MMKRSSPFVLFLVGVLLLGCKPGTEQKETVTLAIAANMKFPMEELVKIFGVQTGIKCELIMGSSGKLAAQISEGAPYDLFLAADMKYPEEVARVGRAASQPRVYAEGGLVLWTAIEGLQPSLPLLAGDSIRHIALANPLLAPYGQAAVEVLQHHGLLERVTPKLVYGESIAQANQFILSGAAEIGFTALSVVLAPNMKGKGRWIRIDRNLHTPIEQGVVLLSREDGVNEGARQFLDFLNSKEAAEVLKKFGYSVDE